ncbi:BatD family protein [Sulfurimonas sp. SWIR-19]|uniref:BatD family protein n=1 Tax=Sulfurimonas sp. SWIR-19 TaxID=2878390 RepID=UPI001CF0EC1F|nr:BatD family protein [Sulfurimonas sp. SWIR-19]UCN01013.1 BatD family protein [Sulfurimonas sp. SWIR-19]
MKNLGKIIIIFSLLVTAVYAKVVAKVYPKSVVSGEVATYTLTITGGEVNKPLISTICGSNVLGTSSQTSIEMINNDYKKSYVLSYQFMPQKSCVIEPVNVEVDGKTERSNSVKVTVKPAVQDKNADFVLNLIPSKTELFVGEPFTLNLVLKQKKDAEAVDSKFIAPDFKGFWIKGESQATRTEKDGFIITKASYRLAPQREGNLTIKPAQLKIATRISSRDVWGGFMPQIKWKSYFSNPVELHVKPLPNNAKIVGNFTIEATADKLQINPNEAVNVTVKVRGEGNLEDIKSFKPYIPGVNVFDEKINIKGNTLTQKLAFVSDKDFTIPPFSLAFYNLKTKRVEKISTQPIHIKVNGAVKKTALKIKREASAQTTEQPLHVKNRPKVYDKLSIGIAFVAGVIIGILIMMFAKPVKFLKKERILNLNDEKLLLIKLLPYKDKDEEVRKVVDILEANLYSSKKEKIDKKLVKELLKKYDIS